MFTTLLIIKFILLIIALAYGGTVVGRIIQQSAVSQVQMFLWAAATAGFITLQWLM